MSTFPRPPNIASNSQSPLDIKCSIEQRRMQPWPMRFIGAVFRARERVQPWTKGTRTSIPDSVGERLYLRSSRHFNLERFLNLHRKVPGKISPRYGKTLRLHDVSGTENLIQRSHPNNSKVRLSKSGKPEGLYRGKCSDPRFSPFTSIAL